MAQKVISVVLTAITGPYQAAMARAAGTTQAFAGAAKGATGQVAGMAQSTGMLNSKLVGAAGLAFGIKEVAGAAIRWESSFAGVRKTVDGTEAQLASIEGGLRDLSVEMGINSSEIAGVAEAAGQLGISTGGIVEFTETMAMLGETTNLSADQAATSLARFSNIMGTAESDLDTVGSVIVDLGNSMATTESEIVDMALRLAGAGKQANLTEGEVLALSAALSSVGIEAEAGGSALSRTMIEISTEVETGSEKVEMFARVAGMSAEQFAAAWREDAAGALMAFIEGLGGMEGASGSALLALEELEITGIRERDALLRLSSASDKVSDALDRQAEETANADALTDEWSKRLDTTQKRLDRARERANDLKITIGESLTPVIGELADQLDRVASFEMPGGGFEFGDVFATGLGAGLSNPFNTNAASQQIFESLSGAKAAQEADSAARQMKVLSDAHGWLTEKVDEGAAAFNGWFGNVIAAADGAETFAGAQADMAMYVEDANGDLQHQLDLFDELSMGPVEQLVSALGNVDEAQSSYNEAVEEFGRGSVEAQNAAWELASAELAAARAADDAANEYGNVESALYGMYEAGIITENELDDIIGKLDSARRAAELYEGSYMAILDVDLTPMQRKLNSLRQQGHHVAIPGVVGAGGITMHTGGIVGGDAGKMPGLAADERLRVLQVGEKVIPAHQVTSGADRTASTAQGPSMGDVTIVATDTHQPSVREAVWQLRRLAVELS